jgi:DNA-binding transcriptional LysR family regulator
VGFHRRREDAKMPFRGSIRELRMFVAAHEERSFTAAAARSRTTQSSVSHHIRQLEAALGVTLFVRDKTGVVPTPAADAIYNQCVETLRRIDESADRVARFGRSPQATFVVATLPGLAHRIVAAAMLRFDQTHPNVKVRILDRLNSDMPKMIRAGEIDFAIGGTASGPGIRSTRLLVTPDCLISRAGAIPGGPDGQEPIDLIWSPGQHERRGWMAAHGLRIGQERELESVMVVLDLVRRSDWNTIGPCFVVDPIADAPWYELRPLRSPDVNVELHLIESDSRPLLPEAADFVRLVVEETLISHEAWMTRFAEAGLN